MHGQAEILSISSFTDCVDIDPSSLKGNGTVGMGKFLDCSTSDPTISDTVTVMDLRLLAGSTGPEAFVIHLTTLKAQNSSSQSSSDPQKCTPAQFANGDVDPTDCQLTNTTYAIHIDNTEFIYYYNLELDQTFDIPYCHLIHIADTDTAACNKPKYSGTGGSVYGSYTANCDARVQQITSCTGGVGSGMPDNDAGDCAYWMDRFSTDRIHDILTGKDSAGGPSQFIDEYYAAHSSTDCTSAPGESRCIRTEFSSDVLRKRAPPTQNPLSSPNGWDDAASASLGEIFLGAAWTDHTLVPPDPLPWGLDQSGMFNNDNTLQILNCLGSCAGNKQNCYNGYGEPGVAPSLRANGTTLESSSVDIGMFGLGPQCAVYRVALLPQIAMRVTMTVTDLSDPGRPSTVVTTDNVRPGSQETDPLHLIGFEILSVGSLNNVLGPPLGGVFLMCGEEGSEFSAEGRSYKMSPAFDLLNPPPGDQHYPADDFFFNMRTQMAPDEYVDDILYNPWENIINQSVVNGNAVYEYYPSNRFMSFNAVCNANGDTIENDSNRTCPLTPTNGMWYYIAPENIGIIGRGCNQIGITDSYWNVASAPGQQPVSQFAADVCSSDPFVCVPGFPSNILPALNITNRDVSFTDLSVTGCMAANAFEILHEVGDGDLLKYFRAPGSTDVNSVSGLSTEELFYSASMVQYIQTNYLPPGYNLNVPNYWFEKESDTAAVGERRVYYKPNDKSGGPPNVNKKQPGAFPLSFEMVVYFVGKFVGYGQIVPSGYFNLTGCEVNNVTTQLEAFGVIVTNTGKTIGDYTVSVACPNASLLMPVDTPQDILDVPPNSTSAVLVFNLLPIPGTDGDKATDSCVITLRPKTEVFSVLDTQELGACVLISPNLTANPPPAPPYVPPGADKPITCGICDFICQHDNTAGLYTHICFYLIVAPLIAFGSAISTMITEYFYRWYKDSEKIKQGKIVRDKVHVETHEKIEGLINK